MKRFMTILRGLGALLAASVITIILLMTVEGFSALVHPFPPGFQGTAEEICLHVARYPHGVLAAVVLMWGTIVLVGTWIAGRLGNLACAALMGALLLAAVLCNVAMLPYPAWFKIVMPTVAALAVVSTLFARKV